jgi:3-dehydroquinate dehydratase type I
MKANGQAFPWHIKVSRHSMSSKNGINTEVVPDTADADKCVGLGYVLGDFSFANFTTVNRFRVARRGINSETQRTLSTIAMKRNLDEITGSDTAGSRELSNEPTPRSLECRRGHFPSAASIAIIGLRGVGKSTIGVVVSAALRRRLIEQDLCFTTKSGMSIKAYVGAHGWIRYREKQADVLREVLSENDTDAVIVCSSDCVETQQMRDLLRAWSRNHPVIHVVRAADEVAAYLRPRSPTPEQEHMEHLLRLAARREPVYSSCSNYEFYNCRDNGSPALPIKKMEQGFLRLLNFIFQSEMSPLVVRDRPRIQSLEKTRTAGLESRVYTYSLALPDEKGGRLEELDLEELETAVEAFELRVDNVLSVDKIDYRLVSQQFTYLRRYSVLPIIYHVCRESQGGTYSDDFEEYAQLLLHGIRLGADYVVVDLDLPESRLQHIADSKGSTKIIGSWFDVRDGWDSLARRSLYDYATRLGFDMVKLTQRATAMDDNLAAISFRREIMRGDGPALIAYNTGSMGKLSQIFNPILSPVGHPSRNPGQLTPKEALAALHACSVFPRLRFYIFGTAVAHSLSPALHNAAFEAYGLPHSYQIYESSTLNGIQRLIQSPNFGGLSVTLPFKHEVIPLLQTISDDAKAIGAVNTIVPIRQGRHVVALHGENTDWIGIRTCILKNLTPVNAITARSTALICGAGGMARAAIYALQMLGVENIFLCNRTQLRADNLAKYFNEARPLSKHRTIVHVIPSLESPWPTNHPLPSVVVSCIPTYSINGSETPHFVLPVAWLQSRTGGVCIEVLEYFDVC